MRTIINIDPALQALKDHLKLDMNWKIVKSADRYWDRFVKLKIGTNQVKVPVEKKSEIRNMHLAQLQNLKNINPDFILIAGNVAKPLRQKLREIKINFVDGYGNASINIGDIHIYMDGLKGQKVPENIRTFRASHLKLIWFLLQRTDYLNKPYRDIAKISGLSLDTISKTLKALEKQNFNIYLNDNEYKLVNKTDLLEKWLIGFEDTLKPKLKTNTYRFADRKMNDEWQNINFDSSKILWGGEPAAAKLTKYLIPEIFTVYTDLSDKELLRQYRMVQDKQGNIEVYQLFFNPEKFHYNDLVPPLLIYADLQISGDERNIETAKIIFEKYIADTIQ
jgi:hypothetical protein